MSIFTKIVTGIFVVTLVSSRPASVMLHAFNWKFSEVESKASEISKLGYKRFLSLLHTKAKEVSGGLVISRKTTCY